MKYSWAVWHVGPDGQYDSQDVNGQRGYTEATDPQALADQLALPLGVGDRLLIWDTVGVGKLPVLTVDGPTT